MARAGEEPGSYGRPLSLYHLRDEPLLLNDSYTDFLIERRAGHPPDNPAELLAGATSPCTLAVPSLPIILRP